jgi:hypothetical protein
MKPIDDDIHQVRATKTRAMCEAIGVDADLTRSLAVTVDADTKLPIARLEIILTSTQFRRLGEVMAGPDE